MKHKAVMTLPATKMTKETEDQEITDLVADLLRVSDYIVDAQQQMDAGSGSEAYTD